MINVSIFNIVFIASEWTLYILKILQVIAFIFKILVTSYSNKVDLKLIAFVSMLVLGRLRYGAFEYDFDVQ